MLNLASALRFDLIHINHEKLLNIGKNKKVGGIFDKLIMHNANFLHDKQEWQKQKSKKEE